MLQSTAPPLGIKLIFDTCVSVLEPTAPLLKRLYGIAVSETKVLEGVVAKLGHAICQVTDENQHVSYDGLVAN